MKWESVFDIVGDGVVFCWLYVVWVLLEVGYVDIIGEVFICFFCDFGFVYVVYVFYLVIVILNFLFSLC